MTPTNKISPELSRYYDVARGLCLAPEIPACFPIDAPEKKEVAQALPRFSAARMSALSSAGTSVKVSSLWQIPNIFNPITLALTVPGCSSAPAEKALPGKPISGIEAVTEEMALNSTLILGKIRQVGLDLSPEAHGVVAWSVIDFDHPEGHGVFGLTSDGSTLTTPQQIAAATGNIPRDTSAAVLANGESVVVFTQIQGDNASPSSLVAQRLSASGTLVGAPIAILPETIRTGFPQGQVMGTSDGFIVVYRDGEGKLFWASYDLNGTEQGRRELGDESLTYQVASNQAGQWALATLGSNSVRVQGFDESGSAGIDVTIDTLPTANSADLSLAMQEDDSMMLAWNSLSGTDSVLEGAFLAPDGSQQGDNTILRNLVKGSGYDNQDHINSHSLTTDHQGNFILAYEENRSIFARVYNGSSRDDHSLTDVATVTAETTGPYGDLVSSWDNVQVQNVDVNVAGAANGLLSFVFTKTYSGVDPSTMLTATVNKMVRRDYQISYK